MGQVPCTVVVRVVGTGPRELKKVVLIGCDNLVAANAHLVLRRSGS